MPIPDQVRVQLLALVLAVALPLAGVMIYVWHKAADESRAAATEMLRLTTAKLASDLRGLYRQSEWMLARIAESEAVRGLRPRACAEEAAHLRRLHPEFVNLMMWTVEGELVCSDLPVPAGVAPAARGTTAFQRCTTQGGFHVSDVFLGRVTKRHLVVFAYSIAGPDGATIGVLTAGVAPAHFDHMLGGLDLPEGSAVAVLDRSFRFVARTPHGHKWRGASAKSLPLNHVPSPGQRTARLVTGVDGINRLYVGEALPESGWKIYAGIPEERLLSRHRAWLIWGIAITSVLVAASAAAAYCIAARLARRFRGMLRAEQELTGRLLRAEEQERGRISRELHDQIGQELTALTLDLKRMRREASPQNLERAIDTACRLIDEVRDVSLALRPPQLDDLGLPAALRAHVEQNVRAHGVATHVDIDLGTARPSPDVEAACFRIAQEALTNVLRHAEASNVWLRLRVEAQELLLQLCDDGVGFDVEQALASAGDLRSLGLHNLFDRARLASGRMEIRSRPGSGTELRAWLPL